MRRRVFLKVAGAAAVVGCVPMAPTNPRSDPSTSTDPGDDVVVDPDAGVVEEVDASAPMDAASTPDDAGAKPDDSGQSMDPVDAGATPTEDAGSPDTGECMEFVLMHDTYAQALYLDGTYGPLTGTILVDYVIDGEPLELEFWHGHGGVNHRFTLLPEHYDQLKQGLRVTITTTEVDSHQHTLFIDPLDEGYRVPGAPDVEVPNC